MLKYLIDRVFQKGEKPNNTAVKRTSLIVSYLLSKGYDLTWSVDRSASDNFSFYVNISGNLRDEDDAEVKKILSY